MRKSRIVAAMMTFALALANAQQLTRTALSGTNVVARVNGVPVFQKDMDAQVRAFFPYYSVHGGQVPTSAQGEIRQKAMDRLLLEELLYQEARRRGFTATAAEVNARILTARQKARTKAEFDEAVAQTYGSLQAFRVRAARALLVEKIWEAEVTRAARVNDVEALKFYRENKKNFERPEAIRLQTISFMFPANATEADKDKAQKRVQEMLLKAQATKTADEFGALAEKNSEDDWRVMNGDHGWVHRGTVDAELEPAFKMKNGQVSGVIVSNAGVHILRVNGYRASKQLSFAQAKKEIRMSLEKQRQGKLRTSLEARLRAKARIELAKGLQ